MNHIFNASIAFEQSYGGIDQMGNVLPIGGVNEKIEGFFDTCRDIGFTGAQGVIIPHANSGDLMLRPDLVEAARDDTFQVFAVKTLHEALGLFCGMPAGVPDDAGRYPEGSLLALAIQQAREYWLKAIRDPRREPLLPQAGSGSMEGRADDEGPQD